MTSYLAALGACMLPNVGGIVLGIHFRSQFISKNGSTSWYHTLKKPKICPPDWVFIPVCTVLYTVMGFASFLVWKDGDGFSGTGQIPLILYTTQLLLNCLWIPVFFGAHSLKWSLLILIILVPNVVACGSFFHTINILAGYLIIPYIGWLTFVTCVIYLFWSDNSEKNEQNNNPGHDANETSSQQN